MKNVRYIIGSLAIMAILFMNFRYAYHNYGIQNINMRHVPLQSH